MANGFGSNDEHVHIGFCNERYKNLSDKIFECEHRIDGIYKLMFGALVTSVFELLGIVLILFKMVMN